MYFKRAPKELLNASDNGQFAIPQIVEQYLGRIDFGQEGLPDALHPWLGGSTTRKSIRIDPRVRFGQPVITGTGVTVDSVRDRHDAGESLEDIAMSYSLKIAQVEDALTYATSW